MSAPFCCPHCGGGIQFKAHPLTRRQAEILRFIASSIDAEGIAPSFEEIAEHFDLSSLSTVHEHLTTLERKGVIHRSYNEARSITVLVRPDDLGEMLVESR